MAAFDKIHSGLAGLDRTLDHIRLGDNVVWQVTSVDEYRQMVKPFAAQAIAENRTLIYIRFAPHQPILESQTGLIIHELDPSAGFETFTGELHRIIAEAGIDAFYIFDCLSELQTAWAADLMMGNFFVVTCPYLFELDTVAWFCLLRHRHSYDTVARIRETTQLLLDLYPDEACLYIHPLKVWKRYSPTMFFPHRICLDRPEEIFPLTDGVSVSRFYRLIGETSGPGDEQNLDSWERFFLETREQLQQGLPFLRDPVLSMGERIVGTESRLLALLRENCTAADLLSIKDRMIGSGKIGGKAAGMLIARRIVARKLPEMADHIEPHDSFFLGSDVFYTYLVHNRLWKLRIQQRTPEGYFSRAADLRDGILAGTVPDQIRGQCLRMLEYFGQSPIIVRSSSLLEDSFGHAFAGKYESIFCVNTGSPEDRLHAFEEAVKRVYASTMDSSALAYRRQRGLQGQDEQMAILVQRVSGSLFGELFMPGAAGVGYSYNTWRWHRDLDPAAGMLRLVAGLGTRAVDRTGNDYPRLVSLDHPELTPSSSSETSRYCQRSIDALDLRERALTTKTLDEIVPVLPAWLASRILEHDSATERRLAENGQNRAVWLGTCSGLVSDEPLMKTLGAILRTLQSEYRNPVDIEFTVNWTANGDFLVNLLQCRPLQTPKGPSESGKSDLDESVVSTIKKEDLFLYLKADTMGPQLHCKVDTVLLVDPRAYYELPYRDKPSVARAIGELNNTFRENGKCAMLIAPGRIGTTSCELGVPVSFAEIGNMKIICEAAFSEAGYQPELSYGSHFFQDLVEASIFYGAIGENQETSLFKPEFFNSEENILERLLPGHTLPNSVLRVYEPKDLFFYSDVLMGSCLCARIRR